MAKKIEKILIKIFKFLGKAALTAVLILFLIVGQASPFSAFEAHIINVTARVEQACQEGYGVSGQKFYDRNQNGQQDESEEGLAGWIVELVKIFDWRYDYYPDNILDGNDLSVFTDVANGLIQCPLNTQCHWNNDGWIDGEDVSLFESFLNSLPLDLGNRLTDQNGNYSFEDLTLGTYQINAVSQDGWTPTTESEITLNLNCGVNEVNFGNTHGLGPSCGDNILDPGETCDDGNLDDGDGCSAICQVENDLEEEISEPLPGEIVINEFLPNPAGADDARKPGGEWVELYNRGESPVDVNGWVLYDNNDNHELLITAGNTNWATTTIQGGAYLVVYRDADGDFAMNNNNGDSVRLYNGYISAGADLIDSHIYDVDAPVNKSFARIPDGSENWVDPIPTPGEPNQIDELLVESATTTPLIADEPDEPWELSDFDDDVAEEFKQEEIDQIDQNLTPISEETLVKENNTTSTSASTESWILVRPEDQLTLTDEDSAETGIEEIITDENIFENEPENEIKQETGPDLELESEPSDDSLKQ